jgi:arginine kinase
MNYPKFPQDCSSLLCKYLTPELFEVLKDKKTSSGFTLEMAIKSGIENIDSGIGVYAGDKESYKTLILLLKSIMDLQRMILIKVTSIQMT